MRVDEQQKTTTGEVVSSAPVEQRRLALSFWLIGGLALAMVAVASLGAWLYADRHQTQSERAAMTAVTAYLDFQTGWESFTLEPSGDPLISGDQQVAQVLTLSLVDTSGLIRVTEQVGVTVFRLADEGGRLRVSEIIWMPYDLK